MAGRQEAEPLVLEIGDLLPDAQGEVVLFADEDVPLSLVSEEPVASTGIIADHVTATGVDVDGLYFYSFENGITIYSMTDLVVTTGTTGV
jgi:hypothetical protein